MLKNAEELLCKSSFNEFNEHLSSYVNEKQSNKMCLDLLNEYAILLKTADYRGSSAIKAHMNKNILPAIAIYRALQSNEISKERAKQCVAEYLEKYVGKYALKLRKFGKLPFFYSLFRVELKKTMISSFPAEGWTTNWVERSSKEMSFNFTKCLYCEVFSTNNCPELIPLFCHNDEICYGEMSSKVKFVRTKTLATGGDCCDFRFIRNK